MKRGKTDEGEKALTEAYAAKPASYTMASIARVLAESAKKAGNESLRLEYLTVLALSGRITADEFPDWRAGLERRGIAVVRDLLRAEACEPLHRYRSAGGLVY